MPGTPVAIALGTNLGDRGAHLAAGLEHLSRLLQDIRVSTIIETEPEGVPDPQAPFLNAAVTGTTTLSPRPISIALATALSPALVDGVSAIWSGRAPISRATAARA